MPKKKAAPTNAPTASPDLLPLTPKETWDKLSPEEQWKLFSDAEFDRRGFERLLRQAREKHAREIADLNLKLKKYDNIDQDWLQRHNLLMDDHRNRGNDLNALRRQIREFGQEPIR